MNLITFDVRTVISDGRPGTLMPAFNRKKGGPLDDRQVELVLNAIVHLNGVSKGNEFGPYKYSSNGNADGGRNLYTRACMPCHGPDGSQGTFEGSSVGAINEPAYLALTSNELLWRYIITGRGKMVAINTKSRLLDGKVLTETEINDLTAYLASWRRQP